ncbi:MAG: hypothetical protein AB7O65_08065 [Candidatus Korobacteraceae bacterium]
MNVATDLANFELIVPCGLSGKPVTSLQREATRPADIQDVCQSITRNFGRVFDRQILWLDTLDALLGRSVGIPVKPPEQEKRIAGTEETFLA